eukprot:1323387-Rhodomonas_salina.2
MRAVTPVHTCPPPSFFFVFLHYRGKRSWTASQQILPKEAWKGVIIQHKIQTNLRASAGEDLQREWRSRTAALAVGDEGWSVQHEMRRAAVIVARFLSPSNGTRADVASRRRSN